MYTLCFDVSFTDKDQASTWVASIRDTKDIFAAHKTLKRLSNTFKTADFAYPNLASLDYRYSNIEIIPIDNPTLSMISNPFSINNPVLAENLGEGLVRLFKDSPDVENQFKIDQTEHIPGDNTVVAILAVPFYFSSSDLLLGFLEHELLDKVSHIRIVKLAKTNRTMVLMKFKFPKDVDPFITSYNGRKFTSLDPETCTVVRIKEIVFTKSNILAGETQRGGGDDPVKIALPYLLPDPFTGIHQDVKSASNYIELATCPVCLERLDSNITGIVTIQCQHSYHCSCLSKWKEDKCPVCRYSTKSTAPSSPTVSKCFECQKDSNLWICLVCGHVGCGRYDNEHAVEHYKATGHCFAMETDSQRVWDYIQDGYVHRLVQNEADGKLVELPLRDGSHKTNEEKIDKIGFEYSKMLITQLESQQEYYKGIIDQLQGSIEYHVEAMNKMIEKTRTLQTQFDKMEAQFKESKKHKAVQNNEWKGRFEEEAVLNEGLVANMQALEKKNTELKLQNDDLSEQINDLMAHFTMESKLQGMGEDAKNGEIVVVPAKTKRGPKKRG